MICAGVPQPCDGRCWNRPRESALFVSPRSGRLISEDSWMPVATAMIPVAARHSHAGADADDDGGVADGLTVPGADRQVAAARRGESSGRQRCAGGESPRAHRVLAVPPARLVEELGSRRGAFEIRELRVFRAGHTDRFASPCRSHRGVLCPAHVWPIGHSSHPASLCNRDLECSIRGVIPGHVSPCERRTSRSCTISSPSQAPLP